MFCFVFANISWSGLSTRLWHDSLCVCDRPSRRLFGFQGRERQGPLCRGQHSCSNRKLQSSEPELTAAKLFTSKAIKSSGKSCTVVPVKGHRVGTGGQCSVWVRRARTDNCSHHQQPPLHRPPSDAGLFKVGPLRVQMKLGSLVVPEETSKDSVVPRESDGGANCGSRRKYRMEIVYGKWIKGALTIVAGLLFVVKRTHAMQWSNPPLGKSATLVSEVGSTGIY